MSRIRALRSFAFAALAGAAFTLTASANPLALIPVKDEVDGKRAVGQLTGAADPVGTRVRRGPGEGERTEGAGPGHGGRQLRAGGTADRRLHDRHVDPQQVTQWRRQ